VRSQKAPRLFLFFLLLILVVASFFEVGSYDSHLANAIADDHPAVWARVFASPNFNPQDPKSQVAAGFIYSSLLHLSAAYSTRISLQWVDWICYFFLAIQTLGLALSLFVFCKVFIKDNFKALLVASLTYFIHPWVFNLAYYPNLIFTPYAGQLVLPFIVMGAASLLKKEGKSQVFKCCLWLSIAGMIHPSLSLQFLVIAFFYLLLREPLKTNLKLWPLFAIPTFFSLLLPLGVMPKPTVPLSKEDILPSLLSHTHAFPWKSPIFWPWEVPSFLAVLVLAAIGFKFRHKEKESQDFWWANMIAFLLLAIFHGVSAYFLFVEGTVFSGLRVTTVCALLLLPFGVSCLLDLLLGEEPQKKTWAFFVLGFLIISQRGLPWVGFLALILLTQQKHSSKKISQSLFFAWWGIFLFSLRPLRALGLEALGAQIRYWIAPAFSFTTLNYLGLLVGSGALFFFSKKHRALVTPLSLVLLLGLGMAGSIQTGNQSREPKRLALLDVQNWARENTPPKSGFITTQWSWLGRSERPGGMIYKPPFGGRNPYFRFGDKNRSHLDRLEDLFAREKAETIGDLKDEALQELSQMTGSQFLVMDKEKENRKIGLPVCFENSHFRVYNLADSDHLQCATNKKS